MKKTLAYQIDENGAFHGLTDGAALLTEARGEGQCRGTRRLRRRRSHEEATAFIVIGVVVVVAAACLLGAGRVAHLFAEFALQDGRQHIVLDGVFRQVGICKGGRGHDFKSVINLNKTTESVR